MEKLNVAVIGCGNIGTVHSERLYNCSDAEIAYLVDLDKSKAERLAESYSVERVETDYRKVLEDKKVDAVIVALPNYLHHPVVIESLRAGKHVLSEKPIALTMEEAVEMSAEAKKADRELAIGVVNRFSDPVNIIRKKILSGDLGELYHISFQFKDYRSVPGLGGWFTDSKRSGGGVMIDWGVHLLDLCFYCAGSPEPVSVSGVTHSRLARNMEEYVYTEMWSGPPDYTGVCDVEEFVSGVLRTEGPSFSFEGAWAENIDERAMHIDFLGDKGGIRLDYGKSFTVYSQKDGILYKETPQLKKTDMFQNQTDTFVRCIQTGERNPAHIEEVLPVQNIIDSLYRSAETGREVVIENVGKRSLENE